MIPKIIHYCWFGTAAKPESVLKCIESWKAVCPDYEIREWTEKDIDVHMNAYTSQAYETKCWGFVPDYLRLWIIYHHGGIYLDTDVRVIKPFDPVLDNKAFAGFEADTGGYVALGLGFGAEAGNKFIREHMELYDALQFRLPDGTLNKVPSPVYTTELLEKYGLKRKKRGIQRFADITVYPKDYFCPQSFMTGLTKKTRRTISVHQYDASWLTEEEQAKVERERKKAKYLMPFYKLNAIRYAWMVKILGMERYEKLKHALKGKRNRLQN